ISPDETNGWFLEVQNKDMAVLTGLGYYLNGFRGFPWLALNFHMASNLKMDPSTLQLLQNSGNLPMVAKPLYGILSDALSIGGARRLPYISIGVMLQALSWGLIPIAGEDQAMLMGCVLITNLGASISEVAMDALTAEYGQRNKIHGLQTYGFMASALGGILGNLLGGFLLRKTQQPKAMFLIFAATLAIQLTVTCRTKEGSLCLYAPPSKGSISKMIRSRYSDLLVAIKDEEISRPLIWIVSSILLTPALSGSLFCYQTQFLNLDPTIVGLSKVTGQLMLFSLTVLYDRFWKPSSLRKLAGNLQAIYALSLLLDLVLVKQLNARFGISNEAFALCFSGLSETMAQFRLLPFYVHFGSLAPRGCEASLMSFLGSGLCLSSILSGFIGVGLSSGLGVGRGDYSRLPLGIGVQFVAALVPLLLIRYVTAGGGGRRRRIGRSQMRRRRNRRVGRV
ncbi:hypothetical protein M569_08149, partial [Genlisea aurea]